jgi:2-polyprenyl-6-methoxyphenol hydroxylase-like FAD-dependent oxidoreductase
VRETKTTVLIVGGGPIGFSCAIELGLRNIPAIVIERRSNEKNSLPKMNSINVRTMEFCRRWGIRDRVANTQWPPDYPRRNIYMTSLDGFELAEFDYGADKDKKPSDISPEHFQRCPQTWFDPMLGERAGEFSTNTIRHQVALEDLEEKGNKVYARVRDQRTGQDEIIVADYLLGCDGGKSTTRDLLGIAVDGNPRLSTETNIYFEADNLFSDKKKATMVWFIGPLGMWSVITAVDGTRTWRLWVSHLPHDLRMTQEQAEAYVRAAIGPDIPFKFTGTLPWLRQQLVARKYRLGRVFLCGDAVHNLTPSGGFGMNTGIQDAVDLCWKLAGVIEGWAEERVLDAYEAERRPIAIRNVNEATYTFSKLLKLPRCPHITERTEQGDRERRELSDYIVSNKFNREYENMGIVLGYRYIGSPICVHEGPPEEPVWTELEEMIETDDSIMKFTPRARPGALAPHFWMADGRSVKDLFGTGFTLLRLGPEPPAADRLIAAAKRRRLPLVVHDIADDQARDLYECKLALIRPDGHVAWRGNEQPGDALMIVDTVRGAAMSEAMAAVS